MEELSASLNDFKLIETFEITKKAAFESFSGKKQTQSHQFRQNWNLPAEMNVLGFNKRRQNIQKQLKVRNTFPR